MAKGALLAALAGMTATATAALDCSGLAAPEVAGATVVAMTAQLVEGRTVALFDGTTTAVPAVCDVNVTLTHGTAGDRVRVEVWLPATAAQWNGRFQGTGGAGFLAGLFGSALAPAVQAGYSAASTDAGVGGSGTGDFTDDGGDAALTRQLIRNFAHQSIHEMAVVGKALTAAYYGTAARRAYFNGCSTGGRQGMMEAQRHPDDFDGIVSGSPAINWDRMLPSELWPYAAQQMGGSFVPRCVLDAFAAGALDACDALDGARDDIITQPGACAFDPATLVGRSVTGCGGEGDEGDEAASASTSTSTMLVTAAHADVFRQMLAGPSAPDGQPLWYGILPGTSPDALAGSRQPLQIGAAWLQNFVLGLGANDSASATPATPETVAAALASQAAYTAAFRRSQHMFHAIIGTDDPDLSAFARAGGKLLAWHGLADELIFSNGTWDYAQRVRDFFAGTDAHDPDTFFRAFVAPGVGHCAGGAGAAPVDPLDALVRWVENGTTPDTLPARGPAPTPGSVDANASAITRNLCRYPQMMVYAGPGHDPSLAASWTCVPGPEQVIIPAAAAVVSATNTTSSASSITAASPTTSDAPQHAKNAAAPRGRPGVVAAVVAVVPALLSMLVV